MITNKNYKAFVQNPDIDFIDLIFTDINGIPRGKRIPIDAAEKLANGIYLPASTITLNIHGSVVEEAGFGRISGEPDYLCMPITQTTRANG